MQKHPCIAIVLATYNGGQYIREQLESIVWQTYDNWKLYIHDDGSTDKTMDIVNEYAQKYSGKIVVLDRASKKLGGTNNFFYILKAVREDYVMFCDQDDVWLKEKIHVTLKRMLTAKKEYGDIPVLVHTDAVVTNEKLEPRRRNGKTFQIAHVKQALPCKTAYFSRFHEDKEQTSFANLLLKNSVQGMTIMINKSLMKYVQRLGEINLSGKGYHDSILASVASIVGRIEYVPIPTVLYRQHGQNSVGVFSYGAILKSDLKWEQKTNTIRRYHHLLVNYKKALLLRKLYRAEMSLRQKRIISHFLERPNDWNEFRELGLEKEFTLRQKVLMRIVKIK